jgi:uncharacterized membrane protein
LRTDPFADFAKAEDGAVAIIVSLMLTVLIGFVALGVDVASLYRDRAHLQAVGDLTAVSAMGNRDDARGRADYAVSRNGGAADAIDVFETGRFLRNPAIAPQDRFTALPQGNAAVNAVRVVLKDEGALHFARIFREEDFVMLNRTALATRTAAVSFSLDSHLVRLNASVLNETLMTEFGTSAQIDIGDIGVLAGTSINLGALLENLGELAGVDMRNPAEVLNATTSTSDLIAALQTVLPSNLSGALNGLAVAVGGAQFTVSSLIGGIDTDLGLTVTDFLSDTDISALDVIYALVDGEPAALDANINVAGILTAQTNLIAKEPAAQSGWLGFGEEGAQLHRTTMRLKTEVTAEPDLLLNLGTGVQVTKITLPVYAELAGATASLEKIGCGGSTDDVAARFSTTATPLHPSNGTSVAALYLGELSGTASPVNPADLEFADLLEITIVIDLPILPDIVIPGLTIQARSYVGLGTTNSEQITFTRGDVQDGNTSKSFGSGNLLSSGVSSLLSNENTEFRLKPDQQGLITSLAGPILAGMLDALPARLTSELVGPLDAVLDATLATAGLELGAGELTVVGHYCEPIRLAR